MPTFRETVDEALSDLGCAFNLDTANPVQVKFIADTLSKEFARREKHIEAGFIELCIVSPSIRSATDSQLGVLRSLFFAGAQTLFRAMVYDLDHGIEPTLRDVRKMDAIYAELRRFVESLADSATKPTEKA